MKIKEKDLPRYWWEYMSAEQQDRVLKEMWKMKDVWTRIAKGESIFLNALFYSGRNKINYRGI